MDRVKPLYPARSRQWGICVECSDIFLGHKMMSARRKFTILALFALTLSSAGPSHADGLEPESSLVATSAKSAFSLDARLPREWWFALDQYSYIGLTNIYVGERNIAAVGESLMTRPERTCSIYDSAICFNTSRFYRPDAPQIVLSGYAKLDGNNALLFGLDTGYRAEKIDVSPALMIGLSRRHYLTEKRDAQFVFEVAGWIGQSVNHRPCYDQYNRSYYCGNLSAWSDFSYNQNPTNLYLKLWFDYAF